MPTPPDRGEVMRDRAQTICNKLMDHVLENHNKGVIKQIEPTVKIFIDLILKAITNCCECPGKYECFSKLFKAADGDINNLVASVAISVASCEKFQCEYTKDMDLEEIRDKIMEKIE